ncbi:concanavalin A-like lectin/glucanase domain-containing protein [Xylariales sp. PMI_506]|nr:concanavalin A-like lectin/glucanase domain-containing protein [Xylariales sp. PMI_506]
MYFNRYTALLLPAVALAQTSTSCNPTTEDDCPSDAGLASSTFSWDFTQGATDEFVMTYQNATYDSTNGLSFSITESGDAPTMQSEFYVFFGTVSVVAKAASGTGIVSCVILESDDLDEVDWEWLGGDVDHVQTDYFGKGNTTSYDRGTIDSVTDTQDTWHNYTLEWTTESLTWLVDGSVIRTLAYADAVDGTNYPQTPMRIKLGMWAASDTGAEGTIEWAGGDTDFSDGPFTMYVQSIDIVNANPASTYTYGDETGDWESIVIDESGVSTTNSSSGSISTSVDNSTTTANTTSSSTTASASGTATGLTTVASSATATSSSAATSSTAASAAVIASVPTAAKFFSAALAIFAFVY